MSRDALCLPKKQHERILEVFISNFKYSEVYIYDRDKYVKENTTSILKNFKIVGTLTDKLIQLNDIVKYLNIDLFIATFNNIELNVVKSIIDEYKLAVLIKEY